MLLRGVGEGRGKTRPYAEAAMPDQPEPSSSFAKAFLPGLVLGLIVGLAIGALVGPLLERSPELKPIPGAMKTPADKRDPHPSDAPVVKPADKPADMPADKPAETPPKP